MTPDGKANGDNGGGPKELTQISAALVAVVGVVTSLAVTGVLAAAQRNHGTILLIGFAAVVAAALIWLLRTLIGTAKGTQAPQATAPTKEQPGWLLVALLPGAKAIGNAEEPGKKVQNEGEKPRQISPTRMQLNRRKERDLRGSGRGYEHRGQH
jgi:hypothetical protein